MSGVFSCHFCRGGAPVHMAAEGGHASCLEVLVLKGADVNAQDE